MQPVRILLADDSEQFRRLLERMLVRLGFQIVASVDSGEAAVAAVTTADPDLAIVDLVMPGINGLETARRLRQIKADIRLLILTLHATPEYRRAAADAGIDAFVCKDDLSPELPAALQRLQGLQP